MKVCLTCLSTWTSRPSPQSSSLDRSSDPEDGGGGGISRSALLRGAVAGDTMAVSRSAEAALATRLSSVLRLPLPASAGAAAAIAGAAIAVSGRGMAAPMNDSCLRRFFFMRNLQHLKKGCVIFCSKSLRKCSSIQF